MELETYIISTASFLAAIPLGYLAGVNYRHYRDTKDWIESHGIDVSFYNERLQKNKKNSAWKFINYYLSYPGRMFAIKKSKK